MRQFLPVLLLLCVLPGCNSVPGFAGQSTTPQITKSDLDELLSKSSKVTVEKQEWEYLVVTNGRVYFYGATGKQPATKPFTDEATGTQSALDKLGAEGWELVAVVGQIGGDQEFILKRPKPTMTSTTSIQP